MTQLYSNKSEHTITLEILCEINYTPTMNGKVFLVCKNAKVYIDFAAATTRHNQ